MTCQQQRITEHELQSLVIDWKWRNVGQYPPLAWMYANTNGAQYGKDRRLAIIQNNKLKAEGLLTGVPDLFLPYPARGYHGYYIELKRPGKIASVRPGQVEFMAWAESAGYLCNVFDDFDAATESLAWYLIGARS